MCNFNSHRVLFLATEEAAPTCLARRHSRQLGFGVHLHHPSTFLRSLRSIPITGLPRYYGRSDSCRPGSSVPHWQHEHRLCDRQVSLLHAHELPIPPSPNTQDASRRRFRTLPLSSTGFPLARVKTSPVGGRLVSRSGRIEFVVLRMDRSPPVALHTASRQRSYLQLRAGKRLARKGLAPFNSCAPTGAPPGLRPPSPKRRGSNKLRFTLPSPPSGERMKA